MEEIITTVKREDGIQVIWQKGNDIKDVFFTFSELIDMRINALDLLEHPKNYSLDPERHLIIFTPVPSTRRGARK